MQVFDHLGESRELMVLTAAHFEDILTDFFAAISDASLALFHADSELAVRFAELMSDQKAACGYDGWPLR